MLYSRTLQSREGAGGENWDSSSARLAKRGGAQPPDEDAGRLRAQADLLRVLVRQQLGDASVGPLGVRAAVAEVGERRRCRCWCGCRRGPGAGSEGWRGGCRHGCEGGGEEEQKEETAPTEKQSAPWRLPVMECSAWDLWSFHIVHSYPPALAARSVIPDSASSSASCVRSSCNSAPGDGASVPLLLPGRLLLVLRPAAPPFASAELRLFVGVASAADTVGPGAGADAGAGAGAGAAPAPLGPLPNVGCAGSGGESGPSTDSYSPSFSCPFRTRPDPSRCAGRGEPVPAPVPSCPLIGTVCTPFGPRTSCTGVEARLWLTSSCAGSLLSALWWWWWGGGL